VIGIGKLPTAPRPLFARRSTLSHTFRRRRGRVGSKGSRRAPRASAINNGVMIFDQPPAELPVATLRPRDTAAQLLLDLRGWLDSKWRWLKPRSIPVAVAFAGMLGVLASAAYLREFRPPEQPRAPVLTTSGAGDQAARLRSDVDSPAAGRLATRPAAAPTFTPR
jgi:hypothetical protein